MNYFHTDGNTQIAQITVCSIGYEVIKNIITHDLFGSKREKFGIAKFEECLLAVKFEFMAHCLSVRVEEVQISTELTHLTVF